MMINIYKISNDLNDKVYIGQTIDAIEHRLQEHSWKSSKCHKLRNAIQKYGKEHFKIELLKICEDQDMACCVEGFYIQVYDSVKNGYNILEFPELNPMRGRKHSEDSKKKMSEYRKGSIPWMKGKSHSELSKYKNKIAHIGKPGPNLGKKFSKETKDKIAKYNQKITFELAEVIRSEYMTGLFTMQKLAEKYDLVKSTIHKIIKYKVYKNDQALYLSQ